MKGGGRRDGRRRRGVAASSASELAGDVIVNTVSEEEDHGHRWAGHGTGRCARTPRSCRNRRGLSVCGGLPRLAAPRPCWSRDAPGTRGSRPPPHDEGGAVNAIDKARLGAGCDPAPATNAGRRRTGIRASHPPTASPPRSTAANRSSATPPLPDRMPPRVPPRAGRRRAGGAPRPGASSRPRSAAAGRVAATASAARRVAPGRRTVRRGGRGRADPTDAARRAPRPDFRRAGSAGSTTGATPPP